MSKSEILDAVDTLLRVHDEWEQDPKSPDVPTEKLEAAVDLAVGVCRTAFVPPDCRELVDAVTKGLAPEWDRYRGGDYERGGRPRAEFWRAFRAVVTARAGATPIEAKRLESVSKLRNDRCSDLMIAKVYGWKDGDRWCGPFFNGNGAPQSHLIEQQLAHEAGKPGVAPVVPADWVHPPEAARLKQHAESQRYRLQTIENREAAERAAQSLATREPSEENILAGHAEGQYDHQIAKECGCSLEHVQGVLAKHGKRSNGSPRADLAAGPKPAPATPTTPQDDAPMGTDAEAVDALILEAAAADPRLGAGEIAAKLSAELEQRVTPQHVGKVLARARRETVAA